MGDLIYNIFKFDRKICMYMSSLPLALHDLTVSHFFFKHHKTIRCMGSCEYGDELSGCGTTELVGQLKLLGQMHNLMKLLFC
jgi:hypothetical protein